MIEAVEVEGFRGLRRLKVEGLGRVNLIIGKNDAGKTALMEALAVAADIDDAAYGLATLQGLRVPEVPLLDFQRFWLPFFMNGRVEDGFKITADVLSGPKLSATVRRGETPHEVAAKSRSRAILNGLWSIDIQIAAGEQQRSVGIIANSETVNLPGPFRPDRNDWEWVGPNKDLGPEKIQYFSELKRMGRESLLMDVLRQVDSRLSSVELLAPTGDQAEIFVRFAPDTPLLNIAMMGDGFQRCFELGVLAVASDIYFLFVDEFENGLHYSVLEPIWRWLAAISSERRFQVFATTHSEECVHAAARAFSVAGDEGLRVIRLDRRGEETVAVVYNRSLVEAADRNDIEIRG